MRGLHAPGHPVVGAGNAIGRGTVAGGSFSQQRPPASRSYAMLGIGSLPYRSMFGRPNDAPAIRPMMIPTNNTMMYNDGSMFPSLVPETRSSGLARDDGQPTGIFGHHDGRRPHLHRPPHHSMNKDLPDVLSTTHGGPGRPIAEAAKMHGRGHRYHPEAQIRLILSLISADQARN
jgi:hypothetical protein